MTDDELHVLVLAHDATNTGAPAQLAQLLNHWRQQGAVRATVVLRRDGPLRAAFAQQSCHVIGLPHAAEAWQSATKVKRRLAPTATEQGHEFPETEGLSRGHSAFLRMTSLWDNASLLVRQVVRRSGAEVVLANTATHGDIIGHLGGLPVVSWVHERAALLNRISRSTLVERQLHRSAWIAAASQAVHDDLTDHFHVLPERVSIVTPFVGTTRDSAPDVAAERIQLQRELAISADTVIVGGCGSLSWEKGPDLFVDLARRVRELEPRQPIAFAWLGGSPTHDGTHRFQELAQQRGVGDTVRFLEQRPSARSFLAAVDLLALPSRSDAFPLVVLEAAAAGTPTVAFGGSGGAPEFIRSDAGIVVPDHDVEAMAHAVLRLANHPVDRKKAGSVAADRVRDELSLARTADALLDLLRRSR